jgi:hypothetical protein
MSWTMPSFSHFFLNLRIALSMDSPSLTFTRVIPCSQPFYGFDLDGHLE